VGPEVLLAVEAVLVVVEAVAVVVEELAHQVKVIMVWPLQAVVQLIWVAEVEEQALLAKLGHSSTMLLREVDLEELVLFHLLQAQQFNMQAVVEVV
jgi:hypothetical protein